MIFTLLLLLPHLLGVPIHFYYLDAIAMIFAPFAGLAASALASRAALKYELENDIVTFESLGIREPPAPADEVDARLKKTQSDVAMEKESYFAILMPWANSILTSIMVIVGCEQSERYR